MTIPRKRNTLQSRMISSRSGPASATSNCPSGRTALRTERDSEDRTRLFCSPETTTRRISLRAPPSRLQAPDRDPWRFFDTFLCSCPVHGPKTPCHYAQGFRRPRENRRTEPKKERRATARPFLVSRLAFREAEKADRPTPSCSRMQTGWTAALSTA